MKTKQKTHYNRGAIMRRAHKIKKETGKPFGLCMSMAWQEAKAPLGNAMAIQPQALPLESFVLGAAGLVKKLARSKIEIGLRVNVTGGIRLTDSEGHAESFGKDYSGAFMFARDNRASANRLEYRP
jgi:protein-disulfide isomerase-like protein with CxxC motif